MFGIDNELVQSYINFATQDGTVQDLGSYLLLYGPIALAILLLVVVYQFTAMAVTGAWRVGRFAVAMARSGSVRVHDTQVARSGAAGTPVAPAAAAPAAAAPAAVAPAAVAPAAMRPVQPVTIKRTPAKVG